MRRFSLPVVVIVPAVLAALSSCGDDNDNATANEDSRLKVVATTPHVADIARNVGGDNVDVQQLLRPNVDPHDFEPSQADIAALGEADVVVVNGVGLEEWLDDTLEASGFDGRLIEASEGIELRQNDEGDDPHIWQNPQNAIAMSTTIANGFAAQDEDDATAYRDNLNQYRAQLEDLDREIEEQINTIPAEQRKLVTNHDAFGYYVDRYGLDFVGSIIPSFDTSAELSPQNIDKLVSDIRSQDVRAVFSESSLPGDAAETIGREANVRVIQGEDALYGDSLGPEGSDADTYITMLRHNTEVIVDGLKNG